MLSLSFVVLLVVGVGLSHAETAFSMAAGTAHLDHDLETPFHASTNILIEAKTLSNFASQRHAEMGAHISNERLKISSTPLQSWKEVLQRFTDEVTQFVKVIKHAASETLGHVQDNEEASYHALQILEATDSINSALNHMKEQSSKHLVKLNEASTVRDAIDEKNDNEDLDSKRMHIHWKWMRNDADKVVHEAKRIKKGLIILKQSTFAVNKEL
jgi:hypothetical protein